MSWGQALSSMAKDLWTLESSLFHFLARGGSYSDRGAEFYGGSLHAAVHVFSLALEVKLMDRPHYRRNGGTMQEDQLANFRNVAVPGTGVRLSVFMRFRAVAAVSLFLLYPVLCFLAAVHHARHLAKDVATPFALRLAAAFHEQLLEPQDWFSFWRINSRLAAWHAAATSQGGTDYHDYGMENKWDWLQRGRELGVPISPFLDAKRLVVKHINEEGGLGIHFYQNALAGGDWIIQEAISNGEFISGLLPPGAPLSTFRVMTASRRGAGEQAGAEIIASVFRAGRAGASTDHSGVFFDVDAATGTLRRGTRNWQWYQPIGPRAWLGAVPWGPPPDELVHPDTGVQITGKVVPEWDRVRSIVADAHDRMCPGVPLAGWDVCLTKEHGICMLEVNLSCNFFRGSFDQPKYFEFIDTYHRFCEQQELRPVKDQRPPLVRPEGEGAAEGNKLRQRRPSTSTAMPGEFFGA